VERVRAAVRVRRSVKVIGGREIAVLGD